MGLTVSYVPRLERIILEYLLFAQVFMTGVVVIVQVSFLYLADWYVPSDKTSLTKKVLIHLMYTTSATIHTHLQLKLVKIYFVRFVLSSGPDTGTYY